ncbi:MAG: TetR/AcrR family transcriptional regulator [Bryobacterales bacterium]|jgi:AcrR family transcriptional regulator|nr:TetR/AcrR family transcriptional regulator [Bryobacterales bacterium]
MSQGILTPEQQKLVLDATIGLAAENDLGSITLDQLSKISGVSGFDIVRHFHSKEKILAAVLERELELIAGSVAEPELRFPGETLRDEIEVLAKIMLQEYRARLPFMGKVLVEATRNTEVGVLFYKTFIQQGRLLFTEFLQVRQRRREVREDVDIEAAAAMYLSALTFILLVVELFGGRQVEPLDDERLVREMSEIFLKGIQSKGT